jgi:hypothetical protein
MLHRLKKDGIVIKEALLKLDEEKLTYDDLAAISKQLPSPEEVFHV